MHDYLILHGVNLNMFGRRDPTQYGTSTLAEIDAALRALAAELDVRLEGLRIKADRPHAAHDDAGALHRGAGLQPSDVVELRRHDVALATEGEAPQVGGLKRHEERCSESENDEEPDHDFERTLFLHDEVPEAKIKR